MDTVATGSALPPLRSPESGTLRSPDSGGGASVASSITARRLERARTRSSRQRTPKPTTGGSETVESEYEGEHNEAGVPDGRGTMRFATGEVYEGEFCNGRIEGRGQMTFPTGDVYMGAFKNDMMEGVGAYRLSDGEAMVGSCKADAPVGEGAMWSPDRQRAWRLWEGIPVEEITPEAAYAIADKLGVPCPQPQPST